ncbi:MAG: DegT/DnrJ/EryC1/StrS family aminotransferase, partial [Tepidiformaceae bacterium]
DRESRGRARVGPRAERVSRPEGRRGAPARHRPRRRRNIPFHIPFTGQPEHRVIAAVLRSGWLTTGRCARRLEEGVGRLVRARHGVALNSCTAGLHLALLSLGVRRGDAVLTTPYTFAATAQAIEYLGARPLFVDIDVATLNLDPANVERALRRQPGVRAILPVHIGGLPCDMKTILALAGKARVPVVEDAAHALGAAVDGRPIGSLSDATCFSFYATKNLTTGEGGMVTTSRRDLADRIRLLSLHGLTWRARGRGSGRAGGTYDVAELGYKYNMSDLSAAIGLAQLARFDGMQRQRRLIARRYAEALAPCGAFDLPRTPKGMTHAWHLYILRLRSGVLSAGRDTLRRSLAERGIGTSVHFQPLHQFSYYRRRYGYRTCDFPLAERESARAVSVPIHPGLTARDQDRVIEALVEFARRYRR